MARKPDEPIVINVENGSVMVAAHLKAAEQRTGNWKPVPDEYAEKVLEMSREQRVEYAKKA